MTTTTTLRIDTTKAAADYLENDWELDRLTRQAVGIEDLQALYRLIDALENVDLPKRSAQRIAGRALDDCKAAYEAAGGYTALLESQAMPADEPEVDESDAALVGNPDSDELAAEAEANALAGLPAAHGPDDEINAELATPAPSRRSRPVAYQALDQDGNKVGRVVSFGEWEPAIDWANAQIEASEAHSVKVTDRRDGREQLVTAG